MSIGGQKVILFYQTALFSSVFVTTATSGRSVKIMISKISVGDVFGTPAVFVYVYKVKL